MEIGLPTAVPDTSQRQQAPAIDDRPAATVEPTEPESRNEGTGRRDQAANPERDRRPPERPDRPDQAQRPNPRLSDEAARALSEATAARPETADAADESARLARERAVQAYTETVLRASTARPSLDFAGGSGGSEPAAEASASA